MLCVQLALKLNWEYLRAKCTHNFSPTYITAQLACHLSFSKWQARSMVKLQQQTALASGLLVHRLDNAFTSCVQKATPYLLVQELFAQMTPNSPFAMQKERHRDALFLVAHQRKRKCTPAPNTAETSPHCCTSSAVKMSCNYSLKAVIMSLVHSIVLA
jgi:hypothetical protein